MDWLSAPLCTFIVFWFIYLLFELFVRRDERKMLIEKIVIDGKIDVSKLLSPGLPRFTQKMNLGMRHNNALRIGLVMIGIGAGFLLGVVVSSAYSRYVDDGYWGTRSVIHTSCVCLCGGAALLISYMLERKHEKLDRSELLKDLEEQNEDSEKDTI